MPQYRAIVSRKKFRATEGYPEQWRYEKKPQILVIPRGEEGNPSPATQVEDKDEDERVEAVLDQRLMEKLAHLNETTPGRMVLRSHTKAM